MAKKLKTLTLPNAQGEPVTYELHPDWDKIDGKPKDFGTPDLGSETIIGILPPEHGGTGNANGYIQIGAKEGSSIGNKATIEGANNIGSGESSHVEGASNTASGDYSHAEGVNSEAGGDYSHAEGVNTYTSGVASHAEGANSEATGGYSHAEGNFSQAKGECSHAEGLNTIASGESSHAEGTLSHSKGSNAHAEGSCTAAWGAASHSEGGADSPVPDTITNESTTEEIIAAQNDAIYNRIAFSLAKGDCSHIEGCNNLALGAQSHAEGSEVIASGNSAHAEGSATVASGLSAHAEGGSTIASGKNAHAEGQQTRAKGEYAHAEGYETLAEGINAHAEGYRSYAEGYASHSEGNASHAEGSYSHSEGYESHAAGFSSHAEGYRTHVEGDFAHVEGIGQYITCNITGDANTTVYQVSSLDGLILGACVRLGELNDGIMLYRTAKIININIDNSTITVDKTLNATTSLLNTKVQVCVSGLALSNNTHVEGNKTIAAGRSQHVQGEFNIADPEYDYSNTNSKDTRGKYAHIVGNGSSHANRSNAHTLDWDGNAWYAGSITATKLILGPESYGTSLPETGVEGQIFFLLGGSSGTATDDGNGVITLG